MVWSCFGRGKVGNLIKIDGILNKERFHGILQNHAVPSGLRIIGRGFIFQQDNDPKHTSGYCTSYIQRNQRPSVLKIMT